MKYNDWILLYYCLLITAITRIKSSEDTVTNTWAVKLAPHTHSLLEEINKLADRVAMEMGAVNLGRIEPFQDLYKFTKKTKTRNVRDDNILENHANILWSSKQVVLKRTKRSGFPIISRGFPSASFNDPKYIDQWHLHNSREKGHDVNATGIWGHNITGRGVVVAVVDDGLEYTNTDLLSNYEPLGSYDFNSDDSDPSPDLSTKLDNTHGTKCAGLIAAVANNSVCGVGVAFGSRVAGIRMLDGSVTDILEAQSFVYKAHVNHIYSCSWGPEDNGRTIEGPGKLAQEALYLGTHLGRYGYGNVYVFASGNGGTMQDNCNYDGYANSVYTLTIGAVDELNKMPYYAEPCAAMLAVTYSNGQRRSIVTTDISNHGGCTDKFSGTSAAAPIASGMVALMLEIRPCLTWRDVQAIVIYSALKMDVSGAHWVANGGGFHHSDQHGFGLMDSYRLTVTAAVWALLPVMVVTSVEAGRAVDMPTGGQPLIRAINVSLADIPDGLVTLEYVAVTLQVDHVCRGSLEITLTSPTATPSTLVTPRRYDTSKDGFDWMFTSARFWGEGPVGKWMLNITDHTSMCPGRERKEGVVYNWTLTFYGSSLTPEDVTSRQELVEEAVSNGSVESPFLCPPSNHDQDDIVIPYTPGHTFNTTEKVGLTLVAVIFAVGCLHFILDFIHRRVKGRCRSRSSSTSVLYVNRGNKENEEASALLLPETEQESVIFLDDGLIRDNENSNNNDTSTTPVTMQAVIPLDDVINQPDAVIPNENLHSDRCQSDRETDGDHGNADHIDETDETSLLLHQDI